jgi:hypothetical protein
MLGVRACLLGKASSRINPLGYFLTGQDDRAFIGDHLLPMGRPTPQTAFQALAINVEDLDLENKGVRVGSEGGDTDWLHFQSGSARLLPRLIGGGTRGRCSWPTGARSPLGCRRRWIAIPRPVGVG